MLGIAHEPQKMLLGQGKGRVSGLSWAWALRDNGKAASSFLQKASRTRISQLCLPHPNPGSTGGWLGPSSATTVATLLLSVQSQGPPPLLLVTTNGPDPGGWQRPQPWGACKQTTWGDGHPGRNDAGSAGAWTLESSVRGWRLAACNDQRCLGNRICHCSSWLG